MMVVVMYKCSDPIEAEDYSIIRNTITIPAGNTSMCEDVARVVDDGIYETPETLRISIASTVPSRIFGLLMDMTAEATICDPEGEFILP